MRLFGRSCAAAAALFATACSSHPEQFIRPLSSAVALVHARVIDGNGGPAMTDRTVIIRDGRISAVAADGAVRIPDGATTLDMTGRTVIPGLVGMHDPLFYQIEAPGLTSTIVAPHTFPKLYLASGVTTIRTAGTVNFDVDAQVKHRIDAGTEPGPKIHLTAPYLVASSSQPDPTHMARQVATYAEKGATSFNAYTTLRRPELAAAVAAAHARGLKVTGRLCAVGFEEAIAAGIDNIEHGIVFDSEFASDKRRDECPDQRDVFGSVTQMDPRDARIRNAIDELVRHGVAVTSTLALFESYAMDTSEIDRRVPVLLSSGYFDTFQRARQHRRDPVKAGQSAWSAVLRSEMAFERAFVEAGGKLLAGADPTGWGGVVAGYADQRGLELLVAAGFTPEQAVQIATSNGARFLGDATTGVIAGGRQADLVVVRGDLSRQISDIRNVDLVFKDGVAYEPNTLIAASAGTLGTFTIVSVLEWPVAIGLALVVAGRGVRLIKRRRLSRGADGNPAVQPG
jgi:imidazolonepropionase-like amidohydrolase